MFSGLLALAMAAEPSLEAALLSCAREAPPGPRRDMCLEAWASLGDHPVEPCDDASPGCELAKAQLAAREWRERTGGLRVFVSRIGPRRVKIGVSDPNHMVERIEVRWTSQVGAGLLRPELRGGRLEVDLPDLAGRAEVVALGGSGGEEIALAVAPIELLDAPPPPPPPVIPPPAKSATEPAASELSSGWWIAAIVVGALLVGGGIYEELR